MKKGNSSVVIDLKRIYAKLLTDIDNAPEIVNLIYQLLITLLIDSS